MEQDGKFLAATGQMPMRENLTSAYPGFFAANPSYKAFADQAQRVVEVPNVPGSIDMWQAFRDAWTKSVIFGRQSTEAALHDADVRIAKILARVLRPAMTLLHTQEPLPRTQQPPG